MKSDEWLDMTSAMIFSFFYITDIYEKFEYFKQYQPYTCVIDACKLAHRTCLKLNHPKNIKKEKEI